MPFEFYNHYGPTEGTVLVISGLIEHSTQAPKVPPMGKQFADNQLWILDECLNPVPQGAVGELCIGGTQVALGYFGRPDTTAGCFVPNPYSSEAGARLYRTGDQVRMLPDGSFSFEGRRDRQIKLRGNRIELDEIEQKLRASHLCKEFVVRLETDLPSGPQLAAFVVPASPELGASDAETYLRNQLPDSMIPGIWISLDALPINANGKIDNKALDTLAAQSSNIEKASVDAASSPILEAVIESYKSVLGLSHISAHDSFFHLGGHSLNVMQVVSLLRDMLEIDLPLKTVFDTPGAASLAQRIEAEFLGSGKNRPAIKATPQKERYPLSFAQERLWLLSQMPAETDPYFVTLALKLTGIVDDRALQKSLSLLVERHTTLRTAILADKGQEPHQTIIDQTTVLVERADWSQQNPEEQLTSLQAFVKKEAERPFFLNNGSPLRATQVKMSATETALILTVHHIAIDGWSLSVLSRDWLACYEAAVSGLSPALPDLSIQYVDYALWQRTWLTGEVLDELLAFWRDELGSVPYLDLPTDAPRPARITYRGAAHPFTVDAYTTQRIRALAVDEGATLSMTLMAAFAATLRAFSQQDDFAIGMPVANREGSNTEDLIGFFVNTLAIRCQFDDATHFADLLSSIRQRALQAYQHRELPFEKLVEELKPERDLSRSPLFQVMFTFQNLPETAADSRDLNISSYPVDLGTAKFDLTLTMQENADSLKGSLEYNTDLFEPTTAERIVGSLNYLLSIAADIDDVSLKSLSLLTEQDQRLLLGYNHTERTYDSIDHLAGFLRRQANETPEEIAVVMDDTQWSYREFLERVNFWAHYLVKIGLSHEGRVAVYLDRSPDMVLALHAIVTAGGAYIPIDPNYPQDRVTYLVEDSAPEIILTSAARRGEVGEARAKVITMDAVPYEPDVPSPDLPEGRDRLAYLIYTSGSTGRPKGTMISHAAIINRLQWMQEAFNIGPGDRILQKTPYSFDVSVWEFFWPFMTGATLVLAEPEKHKDPAYLAEIIDQHRITTLHFVPSMLKAFLNYNAQNHHPSLRTVVCSGEALEYDTQIDFKRRFPHAQLENLYGPTEAAVDVSHWPATTEREDACVPIGKPIANATLHILDSHFNPTAPGVPGELYIGGVQLARGYLNRPELTAERFLPDPFSPSPSARLYRTGDKARFLPDGNIEYLGRLDFQVKLRGFRIELGEIESSMRDILGVADAVVVIRQDERNFTQLVAYIVAESGADFEVDQIRQPLAQALPDYMIPSVYVFLESLPLSPNGKLDRTALPEPEQIQESPEKDDAPLSPIESVVASIWKDVLKIPELSASSNFFELGGHSLLATQILSRIRETFRMEVTMITLFESPNLRDFTQRIVEQSEKPEFIEKIAQAWLKIQAMTPEEKEALRRRKAAAAKG
ncbi:MAG: amino acid adenylation domain-containing protein [Opitutales bacterium]|nr:amino acid adenylation domain-containing protein [Opitutales bacterium]